ncbi:hypothetical protein AGMMS49941_12120 [Deferribacterales bacterium]|nr:hypothetical protein AGMMS49941_12120 [Deferribacterales bacterium]
MSVVPNVVPLASVEPAVMITSFASKPAGVTFRDAPERLATGVEYAGKLPADLLIVTLVASAPAGKFKSVETVTEAPNITPAGKVLPAEIVAALYNATSRDSVVPAVMVTIVFVMKSIGKTAELTKDAPAETEMVLVSVTPADNIVPSSKSIWLAGV